jgi:uncharacterized protein (UPF0248 family)
MMLNFLLHPVVRNVLVLLLLLGIFYFSFMGAMTVALRTDSFWMSVISDSMKHNGERWRDYYTARGENSYKFPVQGGFERGDLLIVQGVSSISEISVGDVLIIHREHDLPLTHRVVEIREEGGEAIITTKGDANESPSALIGDYPIKPSQILGKVSFVIPKLGFISLWSQGR